MLPPEAQLQRAARLFSRWVDGVADPGGVSGRQAKGTLYGRRTWGQDRGAKGESKAWGNVKRGMKSLGQVDPAVEGGLVEGGGLGLEGTFQPPRGGGSPASEK